MHQDGRVVKALDLSSNGRKSSWVRTPLLVMVLSLTFLPSLLESRTLANQQKAFYCFHSLIGEYFNISIWEIKFYIWQVTMCFACTDHFVWKLLIFQSIPAFERVFDGSSPSVH